jgi:hypothetical protein
MLRDEESSMKTNNKTTPTPTTDRSCSAVIAYEDFRTGQWAKTALDDFVRRSTSFQALDKTMWKFDFLRAPKLRQIAAEEAASANMVIIAARRESDIPLPVIDWLDLWINAPQKPLLIALLAGNRTTATGQGRIGDRLQNVASSARIDFLCLEVDNPLPGSLDSLDLQGAEEAPISPSGVTLTS